MRAAAVSSEADPRPKPAPGKRRRLIVAALAIVAVGVGAWFVWREATGPEEISLDLGNGVTMRLVLIPDGKFMMGSPDSEPDRNENEGPQHEVTISKPFYMGVHEVTQEQYRQVMGTNPSAFKGATNPVETVSWDDAMAFCRKLSEKTGRKVTLPTEARWEYACRAGTATVFHTGDDLRPGQANADLSPSNPGTWERVTDWVRKLLGTKAKAASRGPMPVGSSTPNAFGLYDMHGNVWEWCADRYGENYYANSPPADPQGPTGGGVRVLRGGCWHNYPRDCRSGTRNCAAPDARNDVIGFRVAADVE